MLLSLRSLYEVRNATGGLTGVSTTCSVGTIVAASEGIQLTSETATFVVNTVIPQQSTFVSGVSATGPPGSLRASTSDTITSTTSSSSVTNPTATSSIVIPGTTSSSSLGGVVSASS